MPVSARIIGALLVAVPLSVVLALVGFPGYDARSEHFIGTYLTIVEHGSRYFVALVLFLLIAALLTALAVGLWRSPLRRASDHLWIAVAGFVLSAAGFAISAIAGLPVWWWARPVAAGTEPALEAAERSAELASLSQTLLLTVGFGGLLIGMSALGVIAVVRGWLPRWLFWSTVLLAIATVALALFFDGPALWVGFGLLPLLWSFVFGLVLIVRGDFATEDVAAAR